MSQLLKHKSYKSNFELCSKWILTKNLNPGFFSGVWERGGEGRSAGAGGCSAVVDTQRVELLHH